ncbi:hypothetical protein O181_024906 [Austropuccinia psidii MF-1]|uniref:Uncharacterized protein n=1 Tax=Austropuccinia psidii MF-1 TaxID=1389203 RepID=A0A9Q3CHK3_9BASI|nr:hypothetical protein [Austropuccinia psidii MF-1]
MLLRPYPLPDETPTLPSPLLTLPHPCLIFSSAYNPYAPAGPSSYASDGSLTPLMPCCTCLILSAAYHPNACGVPSQHCLLSLCWWSGFLTCLQCRLP